MKIMSKEHVCLLYWTSWCNIENQPPSLDAIIGTVTRYWRDLEMGNDQRGLIFNTLVAFRDYREVFKLVAPRESTVATDAQSSLQKSIFLNKFLTINIFYNWILRQISIKYLQFSFKIMEVSIVPKNLNNKKWQKGRIGLN